MNDTSLTNDEESHHQQLLFVLNLRFFLVHIFYPCLLIWGTIGNALCLRVLLSKKFYKNSTCQYLAILAVIDILFIVMRSSKHIYKLFRDATIFNTSQWVCRILTFFSSALAHMASWILVIVSFDRYFIVTSRYRRPSSTVNRVLWSTSLLFAIVALCNLYYFFILGRSITLPGLDFSNQQRTFLRLIASSNETSFLDLNNSTTTDFFRYKTKTIFVCIPETTYRHFFRIYIPIFDILLVAAIPFLLLCFTNLGIIIFTMRNNRRMRQHRMRQHRRRSHRRHQRLTIMLLSVTLAFIGLTCPSVMFICANRIIYYGRIHIDKKGFLNEGGYVSQPPQVQIMVDICEALWYTKHAMNFILYTLSGRDFRREFMKLFPIRRLIKTSTASLPDESTINTELTRRSTQKKTRNNSLNATYDLPEVVFLRSNEIEFKSLSKDQ